MQWDERIGRRLKLRDLHILMSVAQCGTMGKAAAQLAISQPAVSKAISEMEHTLKVRLLDRTAHGVEPTLYGRSLLKWGNAVFDDLRQSIKEIEHLSDPTVGELRIGCTEPMAWGIVPVVIDRLTRKYPKLIFNVKQADPVTLRDRELRERNIELLIGRMAEPISDDEIQVEILFEEKPFVVAGLRNRWARRRKIELSELVDEPWSVGPPDSFAGSLIADAFRAKGLPPPRINSAAPRSAREGQVSEHPSRLIATVQRRPDAAQSLAGKVANPARPDRNRDIEEPNTQSNCSVICRLRT
jgi:DNA-binding transcriptional LysR family regulator